MLDGRPPKRTQLICNDLRVGRRERIEGGISSASRFLLPLRGIKRYAFSAHSFGFFPAKDQVVLPKHSIEKHGNLARVPCT